MDSSTFWTAVALLLIVEGLLPFMSPQAWRRMFQQLLELRDGQIRFFALCSVIAGLALLWWMG